MARFANPGLKSLVIRAILARELIDWMGCDNSETMDTKAMMRDERSKHSLEMTMRKVWGGQCCG